GWPPARAPDGELRHDGRGRRSLRRRCPPFARLTGRRSRFGQGRRKSRGQAIARRAKVGPMHQVGIVGWRGMVGSVLLERMRAEADFAEFAPVFFSTSQAGADAPDVGQKAGKVEDAKDVQRLKALPVIVSCQGGDYTSAVYPELRRAGWDGYWIDAASTLRMPAEAT